MRETENIICNTSYDKDTHYIQQLTIGGLLEGRKVVGGIVAGVCSARLGDGAWDWVGFDLTANAIVILV